MTDMQRAAIFDLDGTLADSAPDIAAALNAMLREAGLAPFPPPDVVAMVGAGARKLIMRAITTRTGTAPEPAVLDHLQAHFIAFYDANPCVETRLYPGVLAALDSLTAQGWQLGICTNKPEHLAIAVLRKLGVAERFASIAGGREGVPLKPDGAMLQRVLRELGVAPGLAVMIGDSAADLGAGRACGLPVVLFSHGYNDGPVAALGADAVLDDFCALPAGLEQLIGART
jgi:phosphoglycolate phosphatase